MGRTSVEAANYVNRRKALQSLLKLIVLHVFVLSSFAAATVVGRFVLWLGQFIIPTLSPHVAVVGAVTVRGIGLAAILGLPMLVVVTMRRRWLCRWLCPVGLLVDSCAKARPGAKYGYRKIPPVGQWLMLATLGGAIVGWPLFVWLDPLSIFAASLNASRWPLDAAAVGSLSLMAAIVVMSLILPKLWCFKFCPLGGMQEMLFGVRLLATRKRSEIPASLSGVMLARRSAIFAGLGVAGGLVVASSDHKRNEPQLRPPGAVDDTKFKGLCARCGNCVKACPAGIIRQDLRASDLAGLLTPILHFEKGVEKDYDKYCREDCRACTQACPTGAIASLSLEDKLRRPIGLGEVDMVGCRLKFGVQCSICVFDICPQNAINTNDINEFDVEIVIEAAKCNGCGACVLICPEKVIEVRPNGRYTIAAIDTGGA